MDQANLGESKLDKLLRRYRAFLRGETEPLTEEQLEALRGRYWRFDDRFDDDGILIGGEVVTSRLDTPRPLLHLMASNHCEPFGQWGSFWDQHRGGFSCVDSVLAGRMTSHLDTNYVPTAPAPQDVRELFIHEGGAAWPMFPVAGYEPDRCEGFECRFGMDTYRLGCRRAGIDGRLGVFVHPELPLEVWQVTLANAADCPRELSWFFRIAVNVDSYPFYYFVPRVVCEGLLEDGSMVFVNHDQNNKHPRAAFLATAEPLDGFDMMAEVFDGGPRRAPIPAAVARGRCFDSLGRQPYGGLIAAGQFNATLAPGRERTWALAYGKCPLDADERAELLAKVKREVLTRPQEARARLAGIWRDKVRRQAIATPDGELDRYFNVWSRYQARNQARFVRALDKVGYRDILQDLLGVCDSEPEFVRRQLAIALRYQYPDGTAVRQYERFGGGGHDLRSYQDSPVWIPDVLARYLQETGDRAFLDEQVPFLDPQTLQPSRSESGTVYDHAGRALRNLFERTGHHGLCRIGYGDWNDALSKIGGERGVSVWLSCAFVYACGQMAEIAAWHGRKADAADFRRMAAAMTQRINDHAWDGNWYVYAIDDAGRAIGSHACAEGRIHLNVNTWALFAGVAAAAGREQQLWEALAELDTPFGHVLLKPPYTRASRDAVGRIADQLPGMFENGSIYTHGEAFYLFALVCAGRSDEWYAALQKTLSANQVPDVSTAPPHQQSNFFVGPDHERFGENLFSNFTGSLAWYRRSIERICGLAPEFDGLRLAPQPPSQWDAYRVVRNFRGCELDVRFRRGDAFAVTIAGRAHGGFIAAKELGESAAMEVDVAYA
jgi:cellobiose phosphorylase